MSPAGGQDIVIKAEINNLKRLFGLGWELDLSYCPKPSKNGSVDIINHSLVVRGPMSRELILSVRRKFIEYLILTNIVEPYLLNGEKQNLNSQKLLEKLSMLIPNTKVVLSPDELNNHPAKLSISLDRAVKINPPHNKRTSYVANAFGICPGENNIFHIYKNFTLDISVGDIICIVGESGAGKTLLLEAVGKRLAKMPEFGGVIYESDVTPPGDEILINGVGKDVESAIEVLSNVGLNEAAIFLKPYRELSEGQKYRYRIAKMLESGKMTWILDEFCAKLDSLTAKVVAFSLGRLARKVGATLLVATHREDIIQDLAPNVILVKKLGCDVEVRRNLTPLPQECSILKSLVIEEGDMGDYKKLSQFHYRGTHCGYVKKIYKATIQNDLAGVIVYSYPFIHVKYRKMVLPHLMRAIEKKMLRSTVNQLFTRISRVIVAPRFRSIGLGSRLVRDTLQMVNTPYVEMLAVMAKYHPFAEKAGMLLVSPPDHPLKEKKDKVLARLRELGFDPERLYSKRYNISVLSRLSGRELKVVERIVRPALGGVEIRRNNGRLESLASLLSRLSLRPAYLIWKNPLFPDYPEPTLQQLS